MDKQNQVVSVQSKKRINQAVKYGVAVALSSMAISQANAAEIATIGSGLSQEIEAVKALVISLFSAGAILLGIFAGFRYLKRGANSA
ncbi:hypothetical protein [Faucicola boevrei]|uniref:hypothetical protein n=1 Tax=Faucicola boevrei TaxID=346665 RepID=UPI000366FB98|nr:hypothetical protein [Moraxella boevrei]